jgi:hypothetical protein
VNEQWRPPFCPDYTCKPLIRPLTDHDNHDLAQPGYAVFCFGRLAEPIDWTFAGVEHHEDLSNCQMSPLKGNVRWLDNAADWQALAATYQIAHRAAVQGAGYPE